MSGFPPTKQSPPLDRILLLGDSLTEMSWDEHGLAASLANHYARKLEVTNMGMSGYTSRWAKPCFEQWLPKKDSAGPKTALATLWLGANDASLPGEPQHVPLDEYISNLRSIISLFTSPSSPTYSPETSLILITPPPFHPPSWLKVRISRGLPPRDDREQSNTRKYGEAVKALGKELGIPVVDAYTPIWKAAGGKEENLEPFFVDGLHLTAKSYAYVFEGVKAAIAEHYPEKHADRLPMLFPYWRDIPIGALGPEYATADIATEQLATGGVEPF
ncbi:hypothetical protein JCM8097_003588 [Rhodosporidiobolus ruineniae]